MLRRSVGEWMNGRAHHSLYWSFQRTTQPSGTLGGGGPAGASKSAMAMMDEGCRRGVTVRIVGVGLRDRPEMGRESAGRVGGSWSWGQVVVGCGS